MTDCYVPYKRKVKNNLYFLLNNKDWTTKQKLIKKLEGEGEDVIEEKIDLAISELVKSDSVYTRRCPLSALIAVGYREKEIVKQPELGYIAMGNSDRTVIHKGKPKRAV